MSNYTKNAVIILSPLEALEILAALEVVDERLKTTRALRGSIAAYKKQIHDNLTDDQLDDAEAEREVLLLLGKYK